MLNPLAKKLGLKPDTKVLILGAPTGYLKSLQPWPAGLVLSEQALASAENIEGSYSLLQLFVIRRAEVEKATPALLQHASPGAVVWMTYPKKTSGVESDLSREALWDVMGRLGWRAVAAVAIDKVWSGLRFRPDEDVKSKRSNLKVGAVVSKRSRSAASE